MKYVDTGGSLTTNKLFVVKIENISSVRQAADYVAACVPNIRVKDFVFNDKKGTAVYKPWPTKEEIGGYKVRIEKLNITKITDSKYEIFVQYDATRMRPILALMVLIGLFAGIIPGLLLAWMFGDSEGYLKRAVQPALARFEELVKTP